MKNPGRIKPPVKEYARRLRHQLTDAERLLWQHLRKRQIDGLKFRRQHPVGRYIVDFVCIEAGLVIEVDGGQHAERGIVDRRRTAWLEDRGYRVLRFWNNEVLSNPDGVREAVLREVRRDARPPS